MIRRLFYLLWVCTFGLIFVPLKWVLMGTKGGRQRKKMLRVQKQMLAEQRRRG